MSYAHLLVLPEGVYSDEGLAFEDPNLRAMSPFAMQN
jgi:hypothetical protein